MLTVGVAVDVDCWGTTMMIGLGCVTGCRVGEADTGSVELVAADIAPISVNVAPTAPPARAHFEPDELLRRDPVRTVPGLAGLGNAGWSALPRPDTRPELRNA